MRRNAAHGGAWNGEGVHLVRAGNLPAKKVVVIR